MKKKYTIKYCGVFSNGYVKYNPFKYKYQTIWYGERRFAIEHATKFSNLWIAKVICRLLNMGASPIDFYIVEMI